MYQGYKHRIRTSLWHREFVRTDLTLIKFSALGLGRFLLPTHLTVIYPLTQVYWIRLPETTGTTTGSTVKLVMNTSECLPLLGSTKSALPMLNMISLVRLPKTRGVRHLGNTQVQLESLSNHIAQKPKLSYFENSRPVIDYVWSWRFYWTVGPSHLFAIHCTVHVLHTYMYM